MSQKNKLIVYIVGFNEHLSTNDAPQNNGYGYAGTFYNQGSVQPYLQATSEFKNAQSLVFSYEGYSSDGKPNPFPCSDTYTLGLSEDVNDLQLQINAYLQAHQNTEVYLVGHSLGGVIAFAFMASIVERNHTTSLLKGGVLKGVAILDSPLNGLAYSQGYEYSQVVLGESTCLEVKDYTIPAQLQTLGGTASGDHVNILGVLLYGKFVSNQTAAEDAAKLGVHILIVGNTHDLLWQPDVCGQGKNFLSTQYLREVGKVGQGALYVRSFVGSTLLSCNVLDIKKSHFEIMTNGDVQKAIWETFTGNPVDKLNHLVPTPLPPTPVFPPTTIPSPIPTATSTPTPTPSIGVYVGEAWTGMYTPPCQGTTCSGNTRQITLTIQSIQPEGGHGSPFTGSVSDKYGNNQIVNGTVGSSLSEFSSDEQRLLRMVMAGTGISTSQAYIVFSDSYGNLDAGVRDQNGDWRGMTEIQGYIGGSFDLKKIS